MAGWVAVLSRRERASEVKNHTDVLELSLDWLCRRHNRANVTGKRGSHTSSVAFTRRIFKIHLISRCWVYRCNLLLLENVLTFKVSLVTSFVVKHWIIISHFSLIGHFHLVLSFMHLTDAFTQSDLQSTSLFLESSYLVSMMCVLCPANSW